MEERDFEWCFEHEFFFRDWWYYINVEIPDSNWWLDNDSFFNCWKMAKQYAYKIANSVDPQSRYSYTYREILKNTPVYESHILYFLHTMLMSIKNENLEELVSSFKTALYKNLNSLELDENSPDAKSTEVQLHYCLYVRGNENKYDYSLPDGGIKDETGTITQTDETITKTITKTEEESVDVILQNYNSFNNEGFISAIRKAIEKGLIEIIEKGKYKWIGPKEIYKGSSDSALVYFIGKALNLKTDVERVKDPATGIMKDQLTDDSRQDAINRFPKEEIKSLFGKSLIISQWKQIFKVNKKQVWREVIDKFFDENKENKENIIQ